METIRQPTLEAATDPNARQGASLANLTRRLLQNRDLIWRMARREILGRYRGSIVGLAWSFFNPLLMLSVYSFVFGSIFKSRWGQSGEASHGEFAMVLFAGMIVHALFSECINSAPRLILNHSGFVKRVVFPLEILPVANLISSLFHAIVSLCVLVLAVLFVAGRLPWTILFIPLVILPFLLLTLGVSFFLASLGVYSRDVTQTVSLLTTVLLFLSPIFYPVTALPDWLRDWILLNPLTLIIEQLRRVLIWGGLPDWLPLGIYSLISVGVLAVGYWWFQRTRRGFADVL